MYAGLVVESASTGELFADPRHPYTVGLLHSIPRLDGDVGALRPIEGSPPDLRREPDRMFLRATMRVAARHVLVADARAPRIRARLGRRGRARRRMPQPRRPQRRSSSHDPTVPASNPLRRPRPSRDLEPSAAAAARRARPFPHHERPAPAAGDRRGPSGRWGRPERPARPVGRPGGRVRLRQDHARESRRGAREAELRHRRVRWRRRLVAWSRRAETAPAARADGVPGSVRVARSQDDGRQEHRRAARDPPPRLARGSDEQGR